MDSTTNATTNNTTTDNTTKVKEIIYSCFCSSVGAEDTTDNSNILLFVKAVEEKNYAAQEFIINLLDKDDIKGFIKDKSVIEYLLNNCSGSVQKIIDLIVKLGNSVCSYELERAIIAHPEIIPLLNQKLDIDILIQNMAIKDQLNVEIFTIFVNDITDQNRMKKFIQILAYNNKVNYLKPLEKSIKDNNLIDELLLKISKMNTETIAYLKNLKEDEYETILYGFKGKTEYKFPGLVTLQNGDKYYFGYQIQCNNSDAELDVDKLKSYDQILKYLNIGIPTVYLLSNKYTVV